MQSSKIAELFERLGRLVAATKHKSGTGTAWEYTFPNGETHRYVINSIKSHAEAEDDATNLLIWIWNAKDWLKEWAKTNGKNPQVVEDAINADQHLPICGDLANRLKHGKLRKSRSGAFPMLGRICFSMPQQAVSSLTYYAFEVEINVADPTLVEVQLPIVNQDGDPIGDAFDYAERSVLALEQLQKQLER